MSTGSRAFRVDFIRALGLYGVMKRKVPEPVLVDPGDAPQRIGYARVSRDDQDVDRQIRELTAAGCHQIHTEQKSAKSRNRKVLNRILRDLRPQDTLVVTSLDRIARNIRDFYEIMDEVYGAKATFESRKEQFSFTESIGKFILGILALVAQFELDLISDRTKSGMAAARARGVVLGQKKLFTDDMRAKVIKLWTARERGGKWKHSTREVAKMLKISTSLINNRLPGGREAYLPKRRK